MGIDKLGIAGQSRLLVSSNQKSADCLYNASTLCDDDALCLVIHFKPKNVSKELYNGVNIRREDCSVTYGIWVTFRDMQDIM